MAFAQFFSRRHPLPQSHEEQEEEQHGQDGQPELPAKLEEKVCFCGKYINLAILPALRTRPVAIPAGGRRWSTASCRGCQTNQPRQS